MQLENYALGRWIKGEGEGQALYNAINGELVATATSKGLDFGDIIAVSGYIGRSGKGDLYVHIEQFELLTKSLRPLPDKFHGLSDTEAKYRKRYLDLIVNEETRKTF